MRPRVIGVAGGTASGKSTAVAQVAARLGERALLLLHDRYYHDLPHGGSADAHNFDHPDALDTAALVADLDALRAGLPVDLPAYDFRRHVREPIRERVFPRPIVIVEGILVLAVPALRARLDHAVFVDTPADIRLLRRIRRDVSERGRTVESVLAQYEATVRPMHEAHVELGRAHAHVVLDGTRPPEHLADALLAIAEREPPAG